MIVPSTLEGWTLDAIHEVADAGVVENDLFDLKADLQPADHQRKTVAAFANVGGGFLVFGVTNNRVVEGVTNAELVRDFGNRLRDNLTPSVGFRFGHRHALPGAPGRFVYVAHVPRSGRGPHAVYVNGAWAFLKRTAAGTNDPMSYEEIRASFLDTRAKVAKFRLLTSEVVGIADLAHRVNIRLQTGHGDWNGRLPAFDPSALATVIPDVAELFGEEDSTMRMLYELRQAIRDCNAIGPSPWNAHVQNELISANIRVKNTAERLVPVLQRTAAQFGSGSQ